MKKLILSISFFLLIAGASFAKIPVCSDPHDSLLFDGGENIQITSDEDCALKVAVSGSVEAMVRVKVKAMGCGEGPDSVWGWERKQVKTGDYIKAGEEIVTGPDGFLKILLSDGSVIAVDKNSRFTPDNNICDLLKDNISKMIGRVWTKIKKLVGGAKYEVSTERMVDGVRGTEFSVESNEKTDVLKVYEGTVEVKPVKEIMDKIADKKNAELEKMNDDFQNGKITMEEYTQKMTEISNDIQNIQQLADFNIEAGYKCSIDSDGNITGPEPIEPDDDRWFER
jgi:hypothetical protein